LRISRHIGDCRYHLGRNPVSGTLPVTGNCGSRDTSVTVGTISAAMADERERTLQEQLEEIGAQLDWVRGYL